MWASTLNTADFTCTTYNKGLQVEKAASVTTDGTNKITTVYVQGATTTMALALSEGTVDATPRTMTITYTTSQPFLAKSWIVM